MEKADVNKKYRVLKLFVIPYNLILIAAILFVLFAYSDKIDTKQRSTALKSFCTTVESMKQISLNYLETERGYVSDWAEYIESQQMNIEEAVDYMQMANSHKDRYAHLVDMDTYEAYSTYLGYDGGKVEYYKKMRENNDATDKIFIKNMEQMYNNLYDYNVLGKYWMEESQIVVISVGTRVMIRTDEGTSKSYLLLRLIPVNKVKNIWVFPVEYKSAEIGMITKSGAYVIDSNSMKSGTFIDFIRAYNFADDYNKANKLVNRLQNSERGLLEYNNSKGEECYWYYSEFNENAQIFIVGYIPKNSIDVDKSNKIAIMIICVMFIMMIGGDGIYAMSVNKRLRITAEYAQKANLAKTQFLSSVSHDIRTPMNAVIGMTGIAKKNIDNKEKVEKCLDNISMAGNTLLTLINDILDISKVETGKMVLNNGEINICDIFDNLINIVKPKADEKQIIMNIEKDLKYEYMIGDELRLNQIYINLLTNAVKYTQVGGHIDVELRQEEIADNSDENYLIYKVADNGIGMSKEFQESMYNSFSRATDSRINKIQGSGLGLAIVKQIVNIMNGTIQCDSTEGKGTTFIVKIRLKIVRKSDNSEIKNVNSDIELLTDNEVRTELTDRRILIAEDNDINWEIISELLGEYGFACDRAVNGQVCVDMLENSNDEYYSIVLMDVQMPIMNGREATSVIRKSGREYVRNIPIYAMTADAFAEDVQACIDVGMNGHIAKPVNIKNVIEILKKEFRRKDKIL